MRRLWAVVLLVFTGGLMAAACDGESVALVVTEKTLRAALLAKEDVPPVFEAPGVNVLTPQMMTDAGIYHLDLCSPELAADLTPGTGSRWQLAAGAGFRPSAAVLADLIEEIVVYADDHEAQQDFTRFRENLRYCEDRQPDPNSMYVTLAFPALGDESFAFASRPKPGTAGAQEGRPDLHQVLIRRANVVIALGYMQAPATNIATTEALARRALTRFEEAIESQPTESAAESLSLTEDEQRRTGASASSMPARALPPLSGRRPPARTLADAGRGSRPAALVKAPPNFLSAAAQDEETPPESGTPAAREVTVRATLKVEAANRRALAIPAGAILRVRTAKGACLEVPLPSTVTDGVSGGGEAPPPELTIPPATTKPECAEAGAALSIEPALPDGSSIILFAGT